MITNLPSSEDFEKLGKNCLVQAFDIVFETDKIVFEQFGEKALLDDVWKYSQGKLNTAVVLIHQAIESFMKASVCRTSPFLLLEGRRKDWPVLPNQDDKDFNDFYTTPAESLLRTYAATAEATLNAEIIGHIEEMRKLRNQITHGISRTELAPKKLIENVLDTFIFFMGKDAWWREMFDEHLGSPLATHLGFGLVLARFPERLDYVEALLGKTKFNQQFNENTKARRYLCPFCKIQWDMVLKDDQYPYRWAFLSKIEADNEWVVTCLNCTIESPVYREDCYYTDCKGSVRHYWEDGHYHTCLTCGRIQYAGTEAEDNAKTAAQSNQIVEDLQLIVQTYKQEDVIKTKKKRTGKKAAKPESDA
jgi:hypothetical protein